jgi:hypothetical protein
VATNQLTGTGSLIDLLEALTDEQLEEQITYWQERRSEAVARGYASWRYSRSIETASGILSSRHSA